MAVTPVLMSYFRAWWGPLGPIMFPFIDAWREPYYLPFYLTAVTGVIAAVLSLKIRENPRSGIGKHGFPPMLKLLTRPGDFRRLCFAATFFSFSMSMAWPFFIIVQVVWLKNTLLEIAITSAISTATYVAFTIPMGKLSDRVGRRPLIFMGRITYFLVPLLYVLAVDITLVYISSVISGIASATSDNAATAYIYDVSPEGERGSHIAVYNTFTGVVFLFGSLISGLIGQAIAPLLGDYSAVFTMMITSTILRFIASFVYLGLREPRAYPSDFWTECRAFIHRRHHDRV
jgi:MFS family permease